MKGEILLHSKDFKYRQRIDGKDLKEWESEFGLKGMIKHLHSLGWENYQWNYEKTITESYQTHFAEFFSPYYHGMLRGDSKESVADAIEKCLNRAQKYNQCEQKKGHEFKPYQRPNGTVYDNGLIECKHCGFNGYSGMVDNLKQQVEMLEIRLRHEQELKANMIRNAEKEGFGFNIFGSLIYKKDK